MWQALIGSALGWLGGQQSNRQSEDNAWLQMNFQRDMASTQYQRAVADLKAAGLNPMLSMGHGQNAAPQGAQPQHLENPGVASSQGALAAMQIQNLKETNEKLRAETDATTAQAENTRARTATEFLMPDYWRTHTDTSASTAQSNRMHSVLMSAQVNKVQQEVRNLYASEDLTREEIKHIQEQVRNAVLTGGKIQAETSNIKVNTLLHNYEIPRARGEAQAHEGWLGRIAPYMNTATGAARGAANLGLRYYGR